MKFTIWFNLLGLQAIYDVEITPRDSALVSWAISQSGGNKIRAIKELRGVWPDFLGLKEAKDMIDKAW